jgi:predicted dehydrogenase
MRVLNPIAPHPYHRITVRSTQGQRSQKVDGEATYTHQLRAFVRHVREDAAIPTGPDDAVANMRVIDAIYEAAGLSKRGALS